MSNNTNQSIIINYDDFNFINEKITKLQLDISIIKNSIYLMKSSSVISKKTKSFQNGNESSVSNAMSKSRNMKTSNSHKNLNQDKVELKMIHHKKQSHHHVLNSTEKNDINSSEVSIDDFEMKEKKEETEMKSIIINEEYINDEYQPEIKTNTKYKSLDYQSMNFDNLDFKIDKDEKIKINNVESMKIDKEFNLNSRKGTNKLNNVESMTIDKEFNLDLRKVTNSKTQQENAEKEESYSNQLKENNSNKNSIRKSNTVTKGNLINIDNHNLLSQRSSRKCSENDNSYSQNSNRSNRSIRSDKLGKSLSESQRTSPSRKMSKVFIGRSLEMDGKQIKKFNRQLYFLKNQPECVFILDEDLNIIQYNQQEKFELIEKPISSIINSADSVETIISLKNIIYEQINDPNFVFENSLSVTINGKNMREHQFNVQVQATVQDGNKSKKCYLKLYMIKSVKSLSHYSISPENGPQVLFSLMLFLILIFLIFYVPQDLTFGDAALDTFNFYFDMITMVIFSVDIILNFLVAYEDQDGTYEQDLILIFQNQLRSSFMLDFISTIPFDQLIVNFNINTSIIKSVKLFKILKFMKILKFNRIFSFKISSIKFLFGYEALLVIKRASGFFDLMRQNLQILIGAHYQTVIFMAIKTFLINQDPSEREWIQTQHDVPLNASNFDTYMVILNVNVKTALGLGEGAQSMSNPIELSLQMVWMFIGLSLFGQGIGNISSYLNYTNHNEIELVDTRNQFMDICETYNVDSRIVKLIDNEIETQEKNISEINLTNKGHILSSTVYTQLEAFILKDFIKTFSLFSRLNLKVVRVLKDNLQQSKGQFKLQKGDELKNIQFVFKGSLSLFNDQMDLVNNVQVNENFGQFEFLDYCQIKQGLNFHELLENCEGDLDTSFDHFYNVELENIIETCRHQTEQSIRLQYEKLRFELNHELNIIQTLAVEDQNQIRNCFVPLPSNDFEQCAIPFELFEGLMLNDFESFLVCHRYFKKQTQLISSQESLDSSKALKTFEDSITPALILTDDGEVYDVNQSFIDYYPNVIKKLTGVNFIDYVRYEKDTKEKVFTTEDLKENTYKIVFDYVKFQMNIENIVRCKIRSGNDQQKNLNNKKDNEMSFQNMKKCLMSVKIFYFQIEKQIRN